MVLVPVAVPEDENVRGAELTFDSLRALVASTLGATPPSHVRIPEDLAIWVFQERPSIETTNLLTKAIGTRGRRHPQHRLSLAWFALDFQKMAAAHHSPVLDAADLVVSLYQGQLHHLYESAWVERITADLDNPKRGDNRLWLALAVINCKVPEQTWRWLPDWQKRARKLIQKVCLAPA